MPRSRRTRSQNTDDQDASASGRTGGRRSARVPVAGDDLEAEVNTARSSRRGVSSSDRKAKAKKKKSGRRSKPQLSSEERSAKFKGAVGSLLLIVLVLGIVGGAAAAYLHFKEEPTTRQVELPSGTQSFTGTLDDLAGQFYSEVLTYRDRANKAISARDADSAAEHVASMRIFIEQPDLQNHLELGPQANELADQIAALETDVQSVFDDRQSAANQSSLMRRLARMGDIEDLNQLEDEITNFMANPVNPSQGPSSQHQTTFANRIQAVKGELFRLQMEQLRRIQASTTDVVQAATLESQRLIGKQQFSRALQAIDTLAQQNPDADLAQVRAGVVDAMKQGWDKEKTIANNYLADSKAAGADPTLAIAAINRGIDGLRGVVSSYGDSKEAVPFVREAKQMINEFEAAKP